MGDSMRAQSRQHGIQCLTATSWFELEHFRNNLNLSQSWFPGNKGNPQGKMAGSGRLCGLEGL